MSNSSTSGGIGVTGLLGVAFVVLKLCHVIEWSWWWVLAPFWIPLCLAIAVLIVGLLAVLIFGLFSTRLTGSGDKGMFFGLLRCAWKRK